MEKVKSWLPIFSGFYNSIWDNESLDAMEYDYLAEQGLTNDELNEVSCLKCYSMGWAQYKKEVIQHISDYVCSDLIKLNVLKSYTIEKLVSPKYYNYSNDSINITYNLTKDNIKNIQKYLTEHKDNWSKFLIDNFTSRSGFISGYDNNADSDDWSIDSIINNTHQLGKVYEFILTNDNQKDEIDLEYEYYDFISDNIYLSIGDVETIRKELKQKGFYKDKPELVKQLKQKEFYNMLDKTNLKFDFKAS
jgi:hypothetical protein